MQVINDSSWDLEDLIRETLRRFENLGIFSNEFNQKYTNPKKVIEEELITLIRKLPTGDYSQLNLYYQDGKIKIEE